MSHGIVSPPNAMRLHPTRWSDPTLGHWLGVVACLTVVSVTTSVAAPRQSATATVRGLVRDASGGVLSSATIDLDSLETGQTRSTRSDLDGYFQIVSLAPGRYRLTVSLKGFATAARNVELTLDQLFNVSMTLALETRTQRVEVVADDHPLVEMGQTSIGRTITTRELDGLPISVGQFRDFTGLATLAPGVAPDVATNAGGIATAGQNGNNNTFLIDGLTGTPGNLPIDAIQEFKVVSNQFGAEFGQASGAIVDVVTRSGSNTPGGRMSWFAQNGAWNAASAVAKHVGVADPGFNQTDVSGFSGGPLVPNRVFLFGAVREDLRHTQFINSSSAAGDFRPNDPVTTPVDWNLPQTMIRGDVHVGQANVLTLRDNYDLVIGNDAAREPLSANERRKKLNNPSNNLAILDSQIIGSAAVNELRLQGTGERVDQSVDQFCPGCATLNYPDILLGKPANAPQSNVNYALEAAETITWLAAGVGGQHTFKTGVDVSSSRSAVLPANTVGTYRFQNDLPFDPTDRATYPSLFTQTVGGSYHSERETVVSLFAEDDWRPNARVTVSVGTRWDYTRWPGPSPPQNDVAPRMGVSVSPWRDSQTSFRTAVGRYYDERPLQVASDAQTGEQLSIVNPGFQGDLVNFDPTGFNPNRGGQPAKAVLSLFEFASTRTPYTDQASVGIQHQFRGTVGVTADVVRALGHRLPIETDLNYPDPITHLRPDQSVKQIIATETIAQSWYTGLQVGLQTRPMRGQVYALAYTWSTSENDTDGARSFPSDGNNVLLDRGPTLDDARQRLTASATMPLGGAWSIQAVVNTWSGLPYNVTTGSDDNGDGVANDRPVSVGRNSSRGVAFFQADLRLSRVLHPGRRQLECLVEVFNVTNRSNWMIYNGNMRARNDAFRAPASAGPPRQVQVGARWSF